jgi:hypothetical protein
MSFKCTTRRQRAALSALTLVFLLSVHRGADGGPLTHLVLLATGIFLLLLLLARSTVAGHLGWPIGRS